MADPNGDWNEEFHLTASMVKPERLVPAVEAALRARGIQPGLTVMESIDLKSGVLVDLGEELHEVKVAVGGVRGELNIYLEDNGTARLDFSAAEIEGDFEPVYFLWAELGRVLGAKPPQIDGADELDLEALQNEISEVLGEYAPGELKLNRLDPVEGQGVKVERTSNDLIVSVEGQRFQTDGGAGLGDSELEEIEAAVAEATSHVIDEARRGMLARRPVSTDVSRAGRWFVDVYGADGAVRWSKPVEEDTLAEVLEAAGEDDIAVVTRYFKDGRPFFRSPVDPGDTPSFDDLHLFRTWSWLG
ncbi:MAG: hypothetical protein QM723_22600 [Myxococcaceae bacterium]